jgi:D-alanyl-D-alanine carboxypeptidase (penicillin-binding protein 5/6)
VRHASEQTYVVGAGGYSFEVVAAMGLRTRTREPRRRWGAIGVLVVAALVLSVALRLASERVPLLRIQRVLASSVRFRGPVPKLAWPIQGEAAVEVEGVGSLGTSGASTPVPIASVAKVMTAYLTLVRHPLPAGGSGFVMRVGAADVEDEEQRAALGESVVPVAAGERLTERQALEALLLPSANNVAELLADHEAGSTGAFVARMNAAAKRLGMRSTTYTDPSGYSSNTVSTASDQLKLAAAALRRPAFARIVDESSAELPVAGRVANYDTLLGHDGYVGVKTGSDAAAGGCFVFARRVTVAGRRLTVVGAVLGQREGSLIPAALESAQRLGDSAASALRSGMVLPAGSAVLRATGVEGRRTRIVSRESLRGVGWGGLAVPVKVVIGPRVASLRAGQRVATMSVAGVAPASGVALAERPLASPSLGWRLRHLL